jgi:hypothetical protein
MRLVGADTFESGPAIRFDDRAEAIIASRPEARSAQPGRFWSITSCAIRPRPPEGHRIGAAAVTLEVAENAVFSYGASTFQPPRICSACRGIGRGQRICLLCDSSLSAARCFARPLGGSRGFRFFLFSLMDLGLGVRRSFFQTSSKGTGFRE